MTTNRFFIPLLGPKFGTHICWGTTQELNRLFKRRGLSDGNSLEDDAWEHNDGFCAFREHLNPIICLPRPPTLDDPEQLAAVAHEGGHAVNHTLRNIKVEAVDEEVFAHLVGAIVRAYVEYAQSHPSPVDETPAKE